MEYLFAEIIWLIVGFATLFVAFFAWRSTVVREINYHVWLVQMRVYPHRRVFQLVQFDTMADLHGVLETFSNGESIEPNHSTNEPTAAATRSEAMSSNDAISDGLALLQEVENGVSVNRFTSQLDISEPADDEVRNAPEIPYRANSPMDNSGSLSCIKLKFLDETHSVVNTSLDVTVGNFKRHFFREECSSGKLVRLIFRGQILRDDARSLLSYGLFDKCVVHCAICIREPNYSDARSHTAAYNRESRSSDSQVVPPGSASSAITEPVDTSTDFSWALLRRFELQSFTRLRSFISYYIRSLYNAILGLNDDEFNGGRDQMHLQEENSSNEESRETFGQLIGHYLYLIFSVKFLFLWMFVFFYPQYTDRFSLLVLTFLSLLFATAIFSNWQTNSNDVNALAQ